MRGPMTGSAKQSIHPFAAPWIASRRCEFASADDVIE
jgi:hypothetical protein